MVITGERWAFSLKSNLVQARCYWCHWNKSILIFQSVSFPFESVFNSHSYVGGPLEMYNPCTVKEWDVMGTLFPHCGGCKWVFQMSLFKGGMPGAWICRNLKSLSVRWHRLKLMSGSVSDVDVAPVSLPLVVSSRCTLNGKTCSDSPTEWLPSTNVWSTFATSIHWSIGMLLFSFTSLWLLEQLKVHSKYYFMWFWKATFYCKTL